jgi:hypothetical protein
VTAIVFTGKAIAVAVHLHTGAMREEKLGFVA